MSSHNTLSARQLKQICVELVSSCRTRKVASADEIDAFRPGGEKNPGTTVREWLYYHAMLHRWHEREQIGAGRSIRPDQVKGETTAIAPADEATLFAMLGGVGERVKLTASLPPDDDGGDRIDYLTVEPKSIAALAEVDRLDRQNAWLSKHVVVLQMAMETRADHELGAACVTRLTENVGRIVWILTSAGAEPPYDPERDPDAPVPSSLLSLTPIDVMHLLIVHRRVNGKNLELLKQFLPADHVADASGARWSVFIAATAREIGEDPATLLRGWSLAKVVASSALAAKARLDAEAAAKKKADQSAA